MMDPFSLVVGSVGLVQGISAAYKTIQQTRNLPKAFREVGDNLLFVKRTLYEASEASERIANESPDDEEEKKAVLPITKRCNDNLEKLKTIFEKVATYTKEAGEDGSWDVIAKNYYGALLSWGTSVAKGHKVEVLMRAVLEDVDILSKRPLFQAATFTQVARLQDGIEKLSQVETSAPDSELDELSKANIQYNTSGGSGVQNNTHGNISGSHLGHGNQYNFSGGTHTHETKVPDRVQSGHKDDTKNREEMMRALDIVKYNEAKDRNQLRAPESCQWFVQHALYQEWRSSSAHNMLWVSADPGCGKSVLARHLVDNVLPSRNPTICHFFFKDDFENQKLAKNAIKSFLHQLCTEHWQLPYTKLYDLYKNGGGYTVGTLSHLWEVFLLALSHLQTHSDRPPDVVCVLDAFDECLKTEQLELARILGDFYRTAAGQEAGSRPFKLKFIVTSRPYEHIRQEFGPLVDLGLPVSHLSGEEKAVSEEIESEIGQFIESEVKELKSCFLLDKDETDFLLGYLRQVRNRTYLWAHLTLETIRNHLSSKKDVRDIPSTLPQSIESAYQSILDKAPSSDEERKLQTKLLQIVVAATRPLTLEEMHFALSLKGTHRSYKDVPTMREDRFKEQVRNICGLFVTIVDSKVYLLHQTAREFLVGNSSEPTDNTITTDTDDSVGSSKAVNNNAETDTRPLIDLEQSHAVLFQICSWYVKLDDFQHQYSYATDRIFPPRHSRLARYLEDHVFLGYSSSSVVRHFRLSGTYGVIEIMASLLKCLDIDLSSHSTWFYVSFASESMEFKMLPDTTLTSLMTASIWGLDKVVEVLLEDSGIDVNARSLSRRSALAWAVIYGQEKVVDILTAKRTRGHQVAEASSSAMIDVDSRDLQKRTPLHYAAKDANVRIIGLLLAAGANVNVNDRNLMSPMQYAADSTLHNLRKERWSLDADASATNHTTPLMETEWRNYSKIKKMLIQAGADVNKHNGDNGTQLHIAARHGQENSVSLLLDAGANVDEDQIYFNNSLLILAVRYGKVEVVKRLLDAGVDIHAKNAFGYTALFYARCGGHDEIEQLLRNAGAQD